MSSTTTDSIIEPVMHSHMPLLSFFCEHSDVLIERAPSCAGFRFFSNATEVTWYSRRDKKWGRILGCRKQWTSLASWPLQGCGYLTVDRHMSHSNTWSPVCERKDLYAYMCSVKHPHKFPRSTLFSSVCYANCGSAAIAC